MVPSAPGEDERGKDQRERLVTEEQSLFDEFLFNGFELPSGFLGVVVEKLQEDVLGILLLLQS